MDFYTPLHAAYSLTALFWLSWFIAAIWRSRATRRPALGSQTLYTVTGLIGYGMLLSGAGRDGVPLFAPIGGTPGWVLVGAVSLGFLFCWWARLHLGALWSGSVTTKEDHRVVDTGPYRLVRHPIYTGLILSSFALAALKLSAISLAGAALVTFSFWIKARLEEKFLRSELGTAAYDAYSARVPMLMPFWPTSGPKFR